MNILLDTHILIWVLEDSDKLSSKQISLIADKTNNKYISYFSLMEIAIKMKLGKLSRVDGMTITDLEQRIQSDGFILLSIDLKHINAYQNIPLYEQHRDPFDRFLIATAFSEGMSMMTSDEKFKLYEDIIHLV